MNDITLDTKNPAVIALLSEVETRRKQRAAMQGDIDAANDTLQQRDALDQDIQKYLNALYQLADMPDFPAEFLARAGDGRWMEQVFAASEAVNG
jgi:hypothetical protein